MTSKTEDTPTLKILTYNIFMRFAGCSAPSIGDCKNRRLDLFAKHVLPMYDVVCLQEMFGAPTFLTMGRRNFLIKHAKKCGFKYILTSSYPRFWRGNFLDGGLVMLSKIPFEETNKIEYDDCMVQDALAAKGVLHALLKTSSGDLLHVFTTHLQAAYYFPSSNDEADVQIKQLQQFSKFIKDVVDNSSQPKAPILVLGDFNIDVFQDEMNSLYSDMLKLFDSIYDHKFRDLIRESYGGKSIPTTVPYLFDKQTGHEHVLGSNIETETGPRLPSTTFMKDNISRFALRPMALDYALLCDRGHKNLQIMRTRVNEFRTQNLILEPKLDFPFFYLSDHFGVCIDMKFT